MEDLLTVWFKDCNKKIPISMHNITAKALSLFYFLKESKFKDEKLFFNASKRWFENLKSRPGLKNLKSACKACKNY